MNCLDPFGAPAGSDTLEKHSLVCPGAAETARGILARQARAFILC